MKKMILTANGLTNKNIGKIFLDFVNKDPKDIKAIFVPTAAIFAGAIEVLPGCLHDLLDLGIPDKNIFVYDLHYKMETEELVKYDTIYFCGGSPEYLLKRVNESGFKTPLKNYIDNGGIYIGVSAGSIITANDLPENLGYLNCKLSVHGNEGISVGKFDPKPYSQIHLPDNRAIIIQGNNYEVIE